MGVAPAQQLVEQLRTEVKVTGTRDPAEVKALLRADLLVQLGPTWTGRCTPPGTATTRPSSWSSA